MMHKQQQQSNGKKARRLMLIDYWSKNNQRDNNEWKKIARTIDIDINNQAACMHKLHFVTLFLFHALCLSIWHKRETPNQFRDKLLPFYVKSEAR